jgi:hypothetical protein
MPGKKPTTQSFQQRLFCKTTTKLKKEGKSSRQMFLHSPTNFPTNSLFVSIIIQARFHPTFIDWDSRGHPEQTQQLMQAFEATEQDLTAIMQQL